MAILGPQLVITLIMVSVIQKVGQHISLARWILCSTGLTRYLYPTDDELRALAGVPKGGKGSRKGKHSTENGKVSDKFHIPRNLDIKLETAKVVPLDIIYLKFYSEFQWLLDFSVYAAIVYFLTEVCQSFFKIKDEVNLSMVWCFLVVIFCTKVLFSLTRVYFQGEETGERSYVIVMGFAFFLIAMITLIIDENRLELGLETAYRNFNQSAAAFLDRQGIDSSGPASKIVLKFFIAVWCGLIGALFTFPGFRMGRMHWDALRHFKDRIFLKLLLNVSFAAPLTVIIMWIKPLAREYFTSRVFQGMSGPLMSSAAFESLRLVYVIVAVILHFIAMPYYLQCYLNMANSRVQVLKKESGRITNHELQKSISNVFFCLCMVALQYVAPVLMCLFFSFMLKTLGGYAWTGSFFGSEDECPITPPSTMSATDDIRSRYESDESSIRESAYQFTLALESLKQVFTVEVYRGLFGFATWWTLFTWFATSFCGILYQSYFPPRV